MRASKIVGKSESCMVYTSGVAGRLVARGDGVHRPRRPPGHVRLLGGAVLVGASDQERRACHMRRHDRLMVPQNYYYY